MIPNNPFTGSKPWAVLLCKFSNHSEEPQPPSFFTDFVTRGKHGINDYFTDISYGNINLDGSMVYGWFDLPYTLETDKARGDGRSGRIIAAINAVKDKSINQAGDKIDFGAFSGICVMLNAQVDSGALRGRPLLTLNNKTKDYGLVVLDNLAWTNTWAGQEWSHGFLLDHSWSADPDVEYGNPYDVMSAFTNNYGFNDSRFGSSGPGLNAPNLDLFGWLSPSRTLDFSSVYSDALGLPYDAVTTKTLRLTALNHPENFDLFTIRLNASRKDLGSFTYYVEHRVNDGWDRGLPGPCVLIHQVRSNSTNYLVSLAPGKNYLAVGEKFIDHENGITISYVSESHNVATVTVTAPVKYRFREAVAGPVRLDWHIYESIIDILHKTEKERLHQIEGIIKQIRDIR